MSYSFPSNTIVQAAMYGTYSGLGNNYFLLFYNSGQPCTDVKYPNSFIISQYEKDNFSNATVYNTVMSRYTNILNNSVIKHAGGTGNTEEIYINYVIPITGIFLAIEAFSGGDLYNSPSGQYILQYVQLNVIRGYNGTTIQDDLVSQTESTIYILPNSITYPVSTNDVLTLSENVSNYAKYPFSVNDNLTISNNISNYSKLITFLSDIIHLTSNSLLLSGNVLRTIINDFITLRNQNEKLKTIYNTIIADTIYLFNNALCYDWTTTFRICNEFIMLKNYDRESIRVMIKILEVILNDFVLFRNNTNIKTLFQTKINDQIFLNSLFDTYKYSVILIQEEFNINSDINSNAIFQEFLIDYFRTSILLNIGEELFEVYAINLENKALTRYDNYEFNSYASLKNKTYGIKKDGIYILDDKDGEEVVESAFKTGFLNSFSDKDINSGIDRRKMERVALLRFKNDGSSIMRIYSDDGKIFDYNLNTVYNGQQSEVKFGRGLRGTIFQIEFENTGKFDLLGGEIIPVILKRRV